MTTATCSLCQEPVHGRGWCTYHHLNWLRHGDPLATGHIRRRRWTVPEDEYVIANYDTMEASAIAERLGRTEDAVWRRAKALGRGKRAPVLPWSDCGRAELARDYDTMPPADIAVKLGRTTSSVYQQARLLGLSSRKTLIGRSAVADYFDHIDTAEKAYVLGLIAADGNVFNDRVQFGLQAGDADLVRWVRDRLFPDALISVSTRGGYTSFAMTSHPMAASLARWGVVPRKSRIIEWPAALPDPMLRPFLLGYFDGDGSLFTVNNGDREYAVWNLASSSLEFLVEMKKYVEVSIGVALQQIQRRKGTSLYQVSKVGRGAYIISEWLHNGYNLGMARKRIPEHLRVRYAEPPPPSDAEVLAARIRAAGRSGITRKQISVDIFHCNRSKTELDAIVTEVLKLPGYRSERRSTVGRASAAFLYFDQSH